MIKPFDNWLISYYLINMKNKNNIAFIIYQNIKYGIFQEKPQIRDSGYFYNSGYHYADAGYCEHADIRSAYASAL